MAACIAWTAPAPFPHTARRASSRDPFHSVGRLFNRRAGLSSLRGGVRPASCRERENASRRAFHKPTARPASPRLILARNVGKQIPRRGRRSARRKPQVRWKRANFSSAAAAALQQPRSLLRIEPFTGQTVQKSLVACGDLESGYFVFELQLFLFQSADCDVVGSGSGFFLLNPTLKLPVLFRELLKMSRKRHPDLLLKAI